MNIKRALLTSICVSSFFIGLTMQQLKASVYAADDGDAAPTQEIPSLGAPERRGTGGARHNEEQQGLGILVPVGQNNTGFTTEDQPTLYWALLTPPNSGQEFTITFSCFSENKQLLLRTELKLIQTQGLHAINLADYDIYLKDGHRYQWVITLENNDEKKGKTRLWERLGFIEKIAMPENVRKQLANTPSEGLPALYVDAGLWYDAVDKLQKLIAIHPASLSLRSYQVSLLKRAGLAQLVNLDSPQQQQG
jgi:hypothetical protein